MPDNFLFMSDAHIKARTWQNKPKLTGDAYHALARLGAELEWLGDSAPDTLVVGGDWFNSPYPSSDDLMKSFSFFGRFRWIYFICGNHDNTNPPLIEVADAIRNDQTCTIRLCRQLTHLAAGVVIAGVHWTPDAAALKEELAAIADAYDRSEASQLYLVTHAPFKHLLGFDGGWQIESKDITDLFTTKSVMVLAGDVHTRHTLQASDNVTIHSPGSLYPLSRDKMLDDWSVSLINIADGSITDVDVTARPVYAVSFSDMPHLIQLASETSALAAAAGQLPPLLFLSVEGDAVPNLSELPSDVVVELDRGADAVEDVQQIQQADVQTLEEALRSELADEDESAMAVALLCSDDPLAELSNWLTFWGVECIG